MRTRRWRASDDGDTSWCDDFSSIRTRLSRFVGRFVGPHEIEDIVQETFVRSYVAAKDQTIERRDAFMLATARNLALNSLKRAENQLNRPLNERDENETLVHRETPEDKCHAQQQFLAFCEAVAELPLHCRRVFILKKVYGLSQKEITLYLGISQSTVKKHITKGLSMTAQSMRDKGYSVESPGAAQRMDEVQES